MKYRFKCNKCNKVEIFEIPIKDDLPRDKKCKNCDNGIMAHDFAVEVKSKSVRIPHNFIAR